MMTHISPDMFQVIARYVGDPSITVPVCKQWKERTDSIYPSFFKDYAKKEDLNPFLDRAVQMFPKGDQKLLVQTIYKLVLEEARFFPEGKGKIKDTLNRGKLNEARLASIAQTIKQKKARDLIVIFKKITEVSLNAKFFLTYLETKKLEGIELADEISTWMKEDFKSSDSALKAIDFLDLSNQGLCFLPEEMAFLENLRSLNLSHNAFQDLKGIRCLVNLERLKLHDNKLKYLPKDLVELKNLIMIDITKNPLLELQKEIFSLRNVKKIYIDEEEFEIIPDELPGLEDVSFVTDDSCTVCPIF